MKGSSYEEEAPFHVNLEFENIREARDLAAEISQWTPMGGHSANSLLLISLLRGKGQNE